MGLISRVSSRTYRRNKKNTKNVRGKTLRPRRLYRLQPRFENPIHEPGHRQTRRCQRFRRLPMVPRKTSCFRPQSRQKHQDRQWRKKAEAELSGAESCDHTVKAVTLKSSLTATCHPPKSPAKSESCSTKWKF